MAWRQLRLSREGQITDRFTKAIDQLDSTKSLEVRLEGAHLRYAIGLTRQQIESAIRDENTQLPDYLAPPRARPA